MAAILSRGKHTSLTLQTLIQEWDYLELAGEGKVRFNKLPAKHFPKCISVYFRET